MQIIRALALIITPLLLSSCLDQPIDLSSESPEQSAYDTCANSYNTSFRLKPTHKAIVAGVNGGETSCFWSWGNRTNSEAIRQATSMCKRRYGRCILFGDSSGLVPWAARISRMGGTDGTKAGGTGGQDPAVALNDFANALNAAAGQYGQYGRNVPSVTRAPPTYHPAPPSSSVGRRNCPGAAIIVDEYCRPLH